MKSKYLNNYKKDILARGIVDQVKTIRSDLYKIDGVENKRLNKDGVLLTYNTSESWQTWVKENSVYPKYDCAVRIVKSQYDRAKRLTDKISGFVYSGKAIFLTLTFNDETLKKTNFETRRRYIARYLKATSSFYAANVDYGKENGREHYHAIVDISYLNKYKDIEYKQGFMYIEQVREKNDSKVLSKYITKLTHHAFKNEKDIFMPRLIYSRKTI